MTAKLPQPVAALLTGVNRTNRAHHGPTGLGREGR